jgi:hypothetical protein
MISTAVRVNLTTACNYQGLILQWRPFHDIATVSKHTQHRVNLDTRSEDFTLGGLKDGS